MLISEQEFAKIRAFPAKALADLSAEESRRPLEHLFHEVFFQMDNDRVLTERSKKVFVEAIKSLKERDQYALQFRYMGEDLPSDSELGRELSVSRTRARDIRLRLIRHLRKRTPPIGA